MNLAIFIILQGILVVNVTQEIFASGRNHYARIVSLVKLFAFSGTTVATYLAAINKVGLVCRELNKLNQLYFWFVSEEEIQKLMSRNHHLLCWWIFNYVIFSAGRLASEVHSDHEETHYRTIKFFYFALCSWIENLFLHQFMSVAVAAGHAYGALTRLDRAPTSKASRLWALRRSSLNDILVSDLVEITSSIYNCGLLCFVFWSFTHLLNFITKQMNLKAALLVVYDSCRMYTITLAGSVITREVKQEKGGRAVLGSPRRLVHTKCLLAAFGLVQSRILVGTVAEMLTVDGPLMAKMVRFLHFACFSLSCLFMYVTVIARGDLICRTLNELNRFYLLLPRKSRAERALSFNRRLFLNFLAYCLTAFLGSVHTLSTYGYGEWYNFFRSSSFAFHAWMENLFFNQFVVMANVMRALVVGVDESFASVPFATTSQVLAHLHKLKAKDLELKDAIRVINSVYKYNLLFSISWFFMAMLYFIMKRNFKINFAFWLVYVSYRMYAVLSVCVSLRDEADKTAHHLHESLIDHDDPVLKEELEIFSLQLLHRKPEFNACGFFKLDFPLLHSMIATVATYIVILMQLQEDLPVHGRICPRTTNCTTCAT